MDRSGHRIVKTEQQRRQTGRFIFISECSESVPGESCPRRLRLLMEIVGVEPYRSFIGFLTKC